MIARFLVKRLDWWALVLSLIGIGLNTQKNIYCWPVWLFGNLLWAVYAIRSRQLSLLFMQAVFTVLDIYGCQQWAHSP